MTLKKMFTFSFYKNYPFTRNGERVPWLAQGTTAAAIERYFAKLLVVSYTGVLKTFTTDQPRLAVGKYSEIKDCNYCRVKNSMTGETLNYFIVRVVALTGETPDTTPALVYVEEDDFFNNFYALSDSGAVVYPTVRGRVAQTNAQSVGTVESDQFQRQPPVAPIFRKISLKYAAAETQNDFAYIACMVDQNGRFWYAIYRADKTGIKRCSTLAKATKLHNIDTGDVNVQTVAMWLVPWVWAESVTTTLVTSTITDSSEQTLTVYTTILSPGGGVLKVAEYIAPHVADYGKLWVKTPAQAIELVTTSYTTTDQRNVISIYVEPPADGQMSNTFTIYMGVNGELVDVTNDYTLDFAINEAAAEYAQQKVAYKINTASNVISAVGGFIGGVSSGNYFGAVSSAVGGIAGITGQYAALKTPANMSNAGSAANALFYNMIAFLYDDQPANLEEVNYEINSHGYIYPSLPYRDNVQAMTGAGIYVRLSDCDAYGAFDIDAGEKIAEKFLRGARFIALDTT